MSKASVGRIIAALRRPRRPGASGAEAGVDYFARSVTHHGALIRALIVSLAPAADAAG